MFTVTLSARVSRTVTVEYATADGSASSPSDYTPASGTLVFPPLSRSRTVAVPVQGDTAVEADETFSVNIFNASRASIADGTGQGMTLNDDLPSVSIGDVTVPEGNSGTSNAVFTVTLSAASASTVAVDYATADVSAAAPSDYTAGSGTLTYAPGQTSQQVTVAVKGDTVSELDETFVVVLLNPTNATIVGTAVGTGTITNDDILPTLTLSAPGATNEGNSGTTNFVFTVTLSAPSANTVTVDYATVDGSATAPSDYTAGSGTLTYAPGQTSQQITVLVKGDTTVETNETLTVNLSNPTNATIIGTGVGTGTITNDDVLPALTLSAPGATNEGNSGTTNFVFTVTLSAPSANTVTVDYATVDGSATAPSDYTAGSGTLTYAPGQTSQQITVLVKGDTTVETNETLTVNLSNPTNATIIGTGVGTGTITNDDVLPALTLSAPGATNEGNSGTTNFVFTVTLSAPSANTVTVDYATVDGSATAPSDYTAGSGTLTYAPGQTNQQITILVNGDTVNEINEAFTANLSNPTSATIAGTGVGTGTITNDDTPPGLALSAPGATNEGNSGTTNFVFTVTLSAPSANTVTVDYATVDGSATAPSDYTAGSGTLTYAPGQTNKQITILVNGDTAIETNETVTVNLSNPTNATITTASGTATITNDDTAPTLTIASPAALTEGNAGTTVNAVFTVTLSAISANTVTVDYASVDGSATAPSDYTASSGTLTFAPGQTNQQIAVIVKGDTLNEINETFTVNLSNPSSATIAGTGIGTETINNDDAVPTLSINNVSQLEGTGGTTNYVFTVTLSTASGLPVTVDFATANGAAVAPGDYASQTGNLTFNPGQTTKTITVAVVADAVIEANETFTVVLSNPANATITSGTGTGTIQNDD